MSTDIVLLTTYNAEAAKIVKNDPKALTIWVANGRPYFKKHYWFKGLAPQWEAVEAWKCGAYTWEEFEADYRATLTTPFAVHLLETVQDILTNPHAWYDKVYLVCYEKSDEFCHRRILKEVLDERLGNVLRS